MIQLRLSILVLVAGFASHGAAQEPAARLAEEIRLEVTRSNRSEAGRPLPLAGHWNSTGMYREGFTGSYQLELLRQGHHLLPWLEWPPTDRNLQALFKPNDKRLEAYIDGRIKEFEPVVKELARLKLPLSFLATQWESVLTYDKAYFGLPPEKNPNVIGLDGKMQGRVCPFGPVEPWREAGRSWTDNRFFKLLQEWYPDPPLVLLISNNEHAKLQWTEVEKSQRYLEKYGTGRSDDFKRKVVGDGWIERYGALLDGLRSGLGEHWKQKVKFIGYEAFPPVHFGRWGGWKEYSLYAPGRLDPQPVVWDGGSPSYYLHNWMAITDYTLWSPQVETMNWVFMLDEIHKTRPEFWFELSTWDGDQPGAGNDKRKFYAKLGEPFTPARYEGMVQYGMWLMRPRSVRDFRSHVESVEYAGPYFQPILDAVERVWRDETLQRFWRKGRLVANPKGQHPYQADVPADYRQVARWFLLDTSLTPRELAPEEFDNAKPPARQLEIPVYALAYVLGAQPAREWLVYAHSPRQARTGVSIVIPQYGAIQVDVPQSGSFFHVTENDRKTTAVVKGGPASFRLEAPRFVAAGAPVTLAVAEKYSPAGSLETIRWEIGGRTYTGDKITHEFARAGQYLVTVSGWSGARYKKEDDRLQKYSDQVVRKQIPVFVGMKPEKELVCRLLMKGALQDGFKSWIWQGGWDKVDYTIIPDASGANNLGFLAGGTWVQDDRRGLVLELDGKRQRVEIGNSADINAAGPHRQRTVAFWFRPAALDPKRKEQRQVLYEEGGPGAGINLYLDGTTLHAGCWNQAKGSSLPGAWVSVEDVSMQAWHHVALVLNAEATDPEAAQELYIDGIWAAQSKAPLLPAHPGDINIGRSGSTAFHDRRPAEQPGFYFAGRLDDFRILNRALDADALRLLARAERDERR